MAKSKSPKTESKTDAKVKAQPQAPAWPAESPKAEEQRKYKYPQKFEWIRDNVAGFTLAEDRRFRQIQIAFAERPNDEVIDLLQDDGFRWRPEDRVWTKQIDREAPAQSRIDAERMANDLSELIREQKGIGRTR